MPCYLQRSEFISPHLEVFLESLGHPFYPLQGLHYSSEFYSVFFFSFKTEGFGPSNSHIHLLLPPPPAKLSPRLHYATADPRTKSVGATFPFSLNSRPNGQAGRSKGKAKKKKNNLKFWRARRLQLLSSSFSSPSSTSNPKIVSHTSTHPPRISPPKFLGHVATLITPLNCSRVQVLNPPRTSTSDPQRPSPLDTHHSTDRSPANPIQNVCYH